jgi:hypothetical protein
MEDNWVFNREEILHEWAFISCQCCFVTYWIWRFRLPFRPPITGFPKCSGCVNGSWSNVSLSAKWRPLFRQRAVLLRVVISPSSKTKTKRISSCMPQQVKSITSWIINTQNKVSIHNPNHQEWHTETSLKRNIHSHKTNSWTIQRERRYFWFKVIIFHWLLCHIHNTSQVQEIPYLNFPCPDSVGNNVLNKKLTLILKSRRENLFSFTQHNQNLLSQYWQWINKFLK